MTDGEPDFRSSELGTKEYWDKTYIRELSKFHEVGDVGHIWYGKGCHKRVLAWLQKDGKMLHSDSILDLGSGNGLMLFELRNHGYTHLCGVDYSEGAIDLARQIGASKGITDITFEVADVLVDRVCEGTCLAPGKYKLCLDKGTYDAISSMPQNSEYAMKRYRETVHAILREDGRLVITSCNWTKEQLLYHFRCDFSIDKEIPTPKFMFGGGAGSTVTCLVLQKTRQQKILPQ